MVSCQPNRNLLRLFRFSCTNVIMILRFTFKGNHCSVRLQDHTYIGLLIPGKNQLFRWNQEDQVAFQANLKMNTRGVRRPYFNTKMSRF
ncbi:hypothetical protein RchiOBHm_Chr3g0478821 [Rosa chinensis]|uniref:Uncharacterized protein n=1 Tax=Rosa chinensis TaxID=74649 RepID=A0A2P6RD89_ROSCH|nr:hypothetical protein RchiOBHm_Chr3g0478821 [Rosa chinensis]